MDAHEDNISEVPAYQLARESAYFKKILEDKGAFVVTDDEGTKIGMLVDMQAFELLNALAEIARNPTEYRRLYIDQDGDPPEDKKSDDPTSRLWSFDEVFR